jgi:hypothetical protein
LAGIEVQHIDPAQTTERDGRLRKVLTRIDPTRDYPAARSWRRNFGVE